ncbi:hypothetical protein SAMN02799631_02589 [Methylobacterium sp. 174MFSha1.1]|uniref:type II toxin-antitoxin system RelE/ParE family toxin n=1 Tax=Methylobacterium sp. 174MFSha1.1 TaxID=1502749 RepID=UPI0008DFAF5D|nr:type II toxin-antitoxin system RelE/ParE family toxin [Methylobacterium sp. 174MFSha1.1]SFU83246.1 hypothetical protein SAMN02799631_02589 [Methylobacterium sp. 174MFSha1.1]
MHTVIQTPTFLADAKAAGVEDDEREAIVATIAADPLAGDVIFGTGGARKVRIAGRGKGKSGGYRVITFYAAEDVPVFLLALVSKGQRVDLSQAERNALRMVLGDLAESYRQGVAERVRPPRSD